MSLSAKRYHATAVIAEDEPILRKELVTRLASLWPELEVIGEAANGREAIGLFDRHRPDILFLDVEMPVMSGLAVAQHLAGRAHIVFATAYDSHAVAAFQHGAADYILKPFEDDRLALALARLRARIAGPNVPSADALRELLLTIRPKKYLRWIKASHGNTIDLIMVSEVCYFEADAKYTSVFNESREATIRTSIKELAATLDPDMFWQVNRSTIVNVAAIESIVRGLAGYGLKVRSRPDRIRVSETYRHLFKHM